MIRDGQRHARIGSQTPAERLWALEQEEARLSERVHRDQVRRNRIRSEATALRCAFTAEDAAAYQKIAFIKEGR